MHASKYITMVISAVWLVPSLSPNQGGASSASTLIHPRDLFHPTLIAPLVSFDFHKMDNVPSCTVVLEIRNEMDESVTISRSQLSGALVGALSLWELEGEKRYRLAPRIFGGTPKDTSVAIAPRATRRLSILIQLAKNRGVCRWEDRDWRSSSPLKEGRYLVDFVIPVEMVVGEESRPHTTIVTSSNKLWHDESR